MVAQRLVELLYGGFELAAEQARWTVADVGDPLFDRPKPAAAGACPSTR